MASASSRNAAASAPLAVIRNANVRRSRLLRSQRTCSRPSNRATAPSNCTRSMPRIAVASVGNAPASRCAAKAKHALSISVMSPRARAVRVRSRYNRCSSKRRSVEKVMGESLPHWEKELAPAPRPFPRRTGGTDRLLGNESAQGIRSDDTALPAGGRPPAPRRDQRRTQRCARSRAARRNADTARIPSTARD